MGLLYQYKCKECNYNVQSPSDIDYGMMAVVEPHICLDCKIVTLASIGLYGDIYRPHIDKFSIFSKKEIKTFYKCEEYNGGNIKPWSKYNRRCPKCPGRMKKDEDALIECWD